MSARQPSEWERRQAIEQAALRLPTPEELPDEPGYGYKRGLHDLIKSLIAPEIDAHFGGNTPDPIEDQSFEGVYMHDFALELRAVSRALEAGQATTDECELSRTFTADDGARLLAIMSHRMIAAAELSARLRMARYAELTERRAVDEDEDEHEHGGAS